MVNQTPPVIAVLGEGLDGAYEGNSTYVVSNATVINGENPQIVETIWQIDNVDSGTGNLFTIPENKVGSTITAKQKFRDDRTREIISDVSNGITILDRPADAITFYA